MKKIKEEELQKIKGQQEKLDALVKEIGVLTTQQHALCHEVGILNQTIQSTKQELEKDYGSINIDLSTGEYTEIETEEQKPELSKV